MVALFLGMGINSDARWRRGPPPGPRGAAPTLLAVPFVTGTGAIGAPLSADPGSWAGDPAPQIALQWQRNGRDIPDAQAAAYVPGSPDDGKRLRVRVTASNSWGSRSQISEEIAIVCEPPVFIGNLPDVFVLKNSGEYVLDASVHFTGPSLSFSVAGEGVSINPSTGELTVSTDQLRQGATVTVTVRNSGGEVSGSFLVTVTAVEEVPADQTPSVSAEVAPELVAAPSLSGAGKIGSALEVSPGQWQGTPEPEILLQWFCGDAEIAGATGTSYVPGPEADGKAIRCRITATNAAGAAEAVTEPVQVVAVAPVVTGRVPNVAVEKGSGRVTVETAPAFTGESLRFAVAGAGAAIDAASGVVNIGTDKLLTDEPVTVTATNSGGSAKITFQVTVRAAAPLDPLPVMPALVAAPALLGEGRIGGELRVAPGEWSGKPTPSLAFQWRREGADIPGATGQIYAPAPADDGKRVACRVAAANSAGVAEAMTEAMKITYPAPTAKEALLDEIFDQGSGAQTIEVASNFTGQNLAFAATGAAGIINIDPRTGILTVQTDKPVSAEVGVTATNSGGSATSKLQLTVEALVPEDGPAALADEEWEAFVDRDPIETGNPPVVMFRLVDLEAGYLFWTNQDDTAGTKPGDPGWHKCIPHPDPKNYPNVWIQRANPAGTWKSWLDRSSQIGGSETFTIRCSFDDPQSTPLEEAEFLPESKKTVLLKLSERPEVSDPVEDDPASPEEPAPGGSEAATFRLFDIRRKEEHDAKAPLGSEEQYMHSAAWSEDGSVLYALQDNGPVWRSEHNGAKWLECWGNGLIGYGGISIECDPVNPKRVFCSKHGYGDPAYTAHQGIYMSEDGGATWKKVHAASNLGTNRSFNRGIAYAPSTKGASETKTWYCALGGSTQQATTAAIDHGLRRSTDGGRSWTKLGGLPVGTYGDDVLCVAVHPTNPNIVYLTCSSGFFKLTVSGSSFSSQALSGSYGLPTGTYTSLEIDPKNGNDITVCCSGAGIYRTTNGSAWSQILGWNAIWMHSASQADRNVMQAIAAKVGTKNKWTQTGLAGSGWQDTSSVTGRPGRGGVPVLGETRQGCVLSSPVDANRAWGMASAEMFVTSNKGKTWTSGNEGFSGYNFGYGLMEFCFDQSNKDIWIYPMADVGIQKTTNGGLWFTQHTPAPSGQQKTACAALKPGVNGQIILAQTGTKYNSERLFYSENGGASWSEAHSSAQFLYIAYHMQNPNIVYAYQDKSTNSGKSWSNLPMPAPTAVIVGMSRSKSDIIYALDLDGAAGRQIWISENQGSSWSKIKDTTWNIKAATSSVPCFAVHPTNPYVIFTKGPNGGPAKLSKAGSSWTWDYLAGFEKSGADLSAGSIDKIVIDPRYPDVLYCGLGVLGRKMLFRSVDGGRTWQDISAGWPLGALKGLAVHPLTGDLFVSGDGGSRVLAPPYKHGADDGYFWNRQSSNNVYMG